MVEYYFFTVIIVLIYFLNKRFACGVAVIGVFYFLNILPSTDLDYGYYQEAFDNAYITTSYPWFQTDAVITAEPFYLWYTSFWGVIAPFGFPFFLALNFLLCYFLSRLVFKILPKKLLYDFWIYLLPVITPTLFYFSPRSSISFITLFIFFIYMIKKKYFIAFPFLLFAISMHSQYLLMGGLVLLVSFTFYKIESHKKRVFYIILYSSLLFLGLKFINSGTELISSFLSFLPSTDIINSKLGYFENGREGFRFSSIFSIIIYPFLAYKFFKKIINSEESIFLNDKNLEINFAFIFFAIIIFGAVINLAFFSAPHLAGRLSRFSDYLGMGLLFPLYFTYSSRWQYGYLALFLIALLTPVIYSTIYYNVQWGIF